MTGWIFFGCITLRFSIFIYTNRRATDTECFSLSRYVINTCCNVKVFLFNFTKCLLALIIITTQGYII